MSVPQVTALIPHRSLPHGRTRPTIVEAEDGDGNRHEVVVKLFRPEERGMNAAISELVCSLLGSRLGLRAPAPYLVAVPEGFHELVADPEARDRFRLARGLNFGSAYICGASTVSSDRSVPVEKRPEAGGVFAFDCLVQNPDRRPDKPNLLEHNDGYWLIDHDMALAFVGEILIGGPISPWEPRALGSPAFSFLSKHLFTRALGGKEDSLDAFGETLSGLEPDEIGAILSQVPGEWWPDPGYRESLQDYLLSAVSSAAPLIRFAKTFLKP
jgi:hypothetical protein